MNECFIEIEHESVRFAFGVALERGQEGRQDLGQVGEVVRKLGYTGARDR